MAMWRPNRGGTRGVAENPPIIFKKKKKKKSEREEKRGKIQEQNKEKNKKIKKIITNDHNAVHKWVKADEFLRG